MGIPAYPWGQCDHMTTLGIAEAGVGLIIRGQDYIFRAPLYNIS
jgi:hypothetical protein